MLARGNLRVWVGAALLVLGTNSNAAFTITFSQVGGNVVATGSGSINTAALTLSGSATRPNVRSGNALAYIGGTPLVNSAIEVSSVGSVVGPTSFGSQLVDTEPNTASGGLVGIVGVNSRIFVPPGYVSQTPINSSATWNGATFASLGLTPGTYTWTWGAGPTADSFTVVIGAAAPASIPTLSEWAMLSMSGLLALAGFTAARRQRG